MSIRSKRLIKILLLSTLVLFLLGAATGVVLALLHQHPAGATDANKAAPTATPLPACLQVPQQIDWQHLLPQDLIRYGLPDPPTSLKDLPQWILLMEHLKRRSCQVRLPPLKEIHAQREKSRMQQQQACVPEPDRMCSDPNWAGGIAGQFAYQQVQATWTLPCVSQRVASSTSSAWVGLGGVNSPAALVQAGVDTTVDAQGVLTYAAWAEAYTPPSAGAPYQDSQIQLLFSQGLHCGDLMYVQVSSERTGGTEDEYPDIFFIGDMTTGEYQYYNPSWSASDGSSAEWIVERPTFVTGQRLSWEPLANFGTLQFTFCLAAVAYQGFEPENALPLSLVTMTTGSTSLASSHQAGLDAIAVEWRHN